MALLVHRQLACGIEFAANILADRPTAAIEFRVLSGSAHDPPDKLGMARLIDETMEKGTAHHDGRSLLDAFDAIGAQRASNANHESTSFRCVCLPDYLPRVIELHAELIRTPTFPQQACEVAVELSIQELSALEDDPQSLADKLISQQAYGLTLGHHPLGEKHTLETITSEDIEKHWRTMFSTGRMLVGVAGPVDPDRIADQIESLFAGFGPSKPTGRDPMPIEFSAIQTHYPKELEQQQIAICYPGVAATHADYPVQNVLLGVLAGGMSGRLFTEVREKQGLVYWVGASADYVRGGAMIHLGASTTPERCDKTYATLLREVDRLSEDLDVAEVERAIIGIVARTKTRGDITRAHCSELVSDLFHYGHPVPLEDKIARIERVRAADVKRYLDEHPRNRLSVLTLGPRKMENGSQQ